jgi:homoserine O-succinyltransferase/O-acetyltransferase
MPIKIPDDLPAVAALESEGVVVMREKDAIRQDIRPLRVALLNLMPDKIRTETQFARLLGATPLQIELTLVKPTDHVSRNTAADHMSAFYRPWADISAEKFDGIIVTGAPVEKMPFEEVSYWDELCRIFDWTRTNVHSALHICWAAQAALRHFHGVPKHALSAKKFGVFPHRNLAPASPYLRGISDDLAIPVSRWTETRREDVAAIGGLKPLLDSDDAGICLVDEPARRTLYMFNHFEYDSDTLANEYFRDVKAGMEIAPPAHYFENDDPQRPPANRWRSHAHLFVANWINVIYQSSPFEIGAIGKSR